MGNEAIYRLNISLIVLNHREIAPQRLWLEVNMKET